MTPGEVMMWALAALVVCVCAAAAWGVLSYQATQHRLRKGPKK